MSISIHTVAVDGTVTHQATLSPTAVKGPSVKAKAANKLQALIKEGIGGGWLEMIPEFDQYGAAPCVVFGDEEAKLKGMAMNPKATYLWYACLAPEPFRPDTLHGPIVIVTADSVEELAAL